MIELKLSLSKETKGTVVYSDKFGAAGGPIPTLYIKKTARAQLGDDWPAQITVTVTSTSAE